MRLVVFGLLFLAGAAEASFQAQPPRSLHLIDAGGWGATALGVTPPPLVTVPDAPPPPLVAPPPAASQVPPEPEPAENLALAEIAVDPYAGSFVGKEVLAGAMGVLTLDLLAAGAGLGVALAVSPSFSGGWDSLAAFIYGAIVFALLDLALAPLAAAIGAYQAAPKEGNNGLSGAALTAYGAQLAFSMLSIASLIVVNVIAAGMGDAGLSTGFSTFSLLLGLAMHYIGLPMAASYGIHWNGGASRTRRLVERRSSLPPTTPDEFYVQASSPRASPLLAITFEVPRQGPIVAERNSSRVWTSSYSYLNPVA